MEDVTKPTTADASAAAKAACHFMSDPFPVQSFPTMQMQLWQEFGDFPSKSRMKRRLCAFLSARGARRVPFAVEGRRQKGLL
jgi:hypothetical protein